MTDFLAPIGWGIGDLLVSLPAVHGLIEAGREVVLVARAPAQAELARRIEGLAGVVDEDALGVPGSGAAVETAPSEPTAVGPPGPKPGDRWFNLRDHPLQRDWWWGSPEFEAAFGRITIDTILERIARDLGIPRGGGDLVPLRRHTRPESVGRILFVPATDAATKLWTREHWVGLERALAARDVRVTVLGPGDLPPVRALREAALDWIPTPSLGEAVDVVSSSRAIVAVDTGLFHLAVQQGVPAVGLFRRESVFRRDLPWARSLCAPACDPACVAADVARGHHRALVALPQSSPGWTCVRSEESRCMAALTPAEVVRALASLEVLTP